MLFSVYYVQEGLGGELRVIYDPNELSENGTVHLSSMEFSPDGTLAALALNSQGSDATTVKFRDLSREVDFPDTLEDVRFSYIKWTNDGLGVFYAVSILLTLSSFIIFGVTCHTKMVIMQCWLINVALPKQWKSDKPKDLLPPSGRKSARRRAGGGI